MTNTDGELDRLIHAPARLAIVSRLYVVESADATWLQRQSGLTWGNLSSHLSKLEQAGYVDVRKEFVERRPTTFLELTDAGRAAFDAYRQSIAALLDLEA